MRIVKRIALVSIVVIVAIASAGLAVLYIEGSAAPDKSGEYVGLGSSFAAGPKLGLLVPGSPHACWRTVENYAHQLARLTGLRLVDVSCGGATARNIMEGGPFFQRPQIEAVGSSARLVTITVGGNDIDYIGDLGLLAIRSRDDLLGRLVRTLWKGPRAVAARSFDQVESRLAAVVAGVRERAPQATVVLVTYPRVLPESGTCPALAISAAEADLMRGVAQRLVQATSAAATRSGALLVDMASESAGHDACSAEPWTNGFEAREGAMFHPTPAGARATAAAIERVVHHLRDRGRIQA